MSLKDEAGLRRDALGIFRKGLHAADASLAVRSHLSRVDNRLTLGSLVLDLGAFERIFLIGVGKAAVPMAQAVREILGGSLDGELIVTKYGHGGNPVPHASIIESGHPIPDREGVRAAHLVRDLARQLGQKELLVLALSGGASALLPAPAEPVTLSAKQETTDLLLKAGANIGELNAVRKHLSFLKGGRLAQLANGATVAALLLSDVIGDRLDVIGSGPTAPDPSTFADALGVLDRFKLLGRVPAVVPAVVRDRLTKGAAGEIGETPKPGDWAFRNVHNIVIGSNRLALEASAEEARRLGYNTLIVASSIDGETREVASAQAQILREVSRTGLPVARPACILSGGETTVTIRGAGKGGRNQEFALAAALAISDLDRVVVLSAGTDGTDGPTDAAGALATEATIGRARALGLDPAEALARNDSYPFFDSLGDLVRTGPTGTNVMDIHILLAG